MTSYLSVDTEATGLKEDCFLIQLAFVPVDVEKGVVRTELGRETLVKCPSFESLRPTLNPWVVKHNREMIERAHSEGIPMDEVKAWVQQYLEWEPVRQIFGEERPVFLGKSLSALDIPLLKRYLGEDFLASRFHHHTADVTSAARLLVDSGVLPPGGATGSKLLGFLGIRDNVAHTALSDAVDMGEAYLRLVSLLKKKLAEKTA